MIRINYFTIAVFGVLLTSCVNSSQKVTEEHNSSGSHEREVFIERHDTVYASIDFLDASREDDNMTIISRTYDIGKFLSLKASGALEIIFIESEQCSVEVKGTKKQLNNLVCETQNGFLHLYVKPSDNDNVVNNGNGNITIGDVSSNSIVVVGDRNRVVKGANKTSTIVNNSPIKIVVKGKLTNVLKLSGSCSFSTNSIETPKEFDINLSSSSRTMIGKITCQSLEVEVSSAATLQVSTVIAKKIDVNASSAAVLTMAVECESIEIEASSASICNITGKAKHVETEKSSAAEINISGLQKM